MGKKVDEIASDIAAVGRRRPVQGLSSYTSVMGSYPGMVEPGNINLTDRPEHINPDGSVSTVLSATFDIDGHQVLLPTIADDGKPMSDDEAVAQYTSTGRHLGKFKDSAAAELYAQQLHRQQEAAGHGLGSHMVNSLKGFPR